MKSNSKSKLLLSFYYARQQACSDKGDEVGVKKWADKVANFNGEDKIEI